MREGFIAFLALTLVGVAAFGFSTMGGHEEGHDHGNNCFAAMTKGLDCPTESNGIDFASFHLSAFRDISLAMVGEHFSGALLILLASLLLFGVGNVTSLIEKPARIALSPAFRVFESFFSPQRYQFAHWYALHENSPSF